MGGGRCTPLPPLLLCPLLKISLGNPYLKILDLTKLFVADAPMKKKKEKKFSFTPSQSTLKYGSKNRPGPKGLKGLEEVLNRSDSPTQCACVEKRFAARISHSKKI